MSRSRMSKPTTSNTGVNVQPLPHDAPIMAGVVHGVVATPIPTKPN
ncbi:Uncharacterised protein [Vibrio cholerae]|nr:Uncharacterised protein [Vibrio cholerae]